MAKKKDEVAVDPRRGYLETLAKNKQTKVLQPEVAEQVISIVSALGQKCDRRPISDGKSTYGELVSVPRGFYIVIDKV